VSSLNNHPPALDDGLPISATIAEEIAAVQGHCGASIAHGDFDAIACLPNLPANPEAWFALLSGIPQNQECVRQLQQLEADAQKKPGYVPGSLEYFGILQALFEACPQLSASVVHPSIHHEFCVAARRVIDRSQGWPNNFHHRTDAFEELCRIVTLRRFHAGQLSFDIMSMPRTWLLKIHPFCLPRVIREVFGRMNGIRPIAMPHLNYWRRNPFLMTREENERSMWRIAKSIELRPDIKGFVAASWFYCATVGEISPHLAWVREFFQDNGAFLIDMEPAPVRSGFMVGSAQRRKLYAQGKFRPRQTLVLWPRAQMLRWAAAYQTEPTGQRGETVTSGASQRARRSDPARLSTFVQATSSGRFTIFNCERMLTDTPRRYVLAIFLLPWIVLVATSIFAFGLSGAILTAIFAPICIWLFQYLFLQ
jgi:hypothetical protein